MRAYGFNPSLRTAIKTAISQGCGIGTSLRPTRNSTTPSRAGKLRLQDAGTRGRSLIRAKSIHAHRSLREETSMENRFIRSALLASSLLLAGSLLAAGPALAADVTPDRLA